MKKLFIAFLLALIILPSILAINLKVEKTSSEEVLIVDLNKPAQFDLEITNLGASDYFEFYNLLGFQMFPVGTTYIASGQAKDVTLRISPLGEMKERGHYTFDYFIRGQDKTESRQTLTFAIIDLQDAFEVGSGSIDPVSQSLQIYIHNKNNLDFENMTARFSSPFFDFTKSFTLGAYERENFDVQIKKEDFKSLMAGFYTLNVDVDVGGKKADIEGVIKFVEKDILTTSTSNYGFIINTDVIKKVNDGNIVAKTETIVKKNIISRLFTTLTPEPDSVDRQGLTVYYVWNKDLGPGDALEVTVRTNWLLPLLVVLLLVAIVLLTKQYSKTHLVLKKRVNFVKAKGGEFALKVSIFVSAKKFVERVNIIDRLPPLVKLYDRYGGDKPTRIDEKNKRIDW